MTTKTKAIEIGKVTQNNAKLGLVVHCPRTKITGKISSIGESGWILSYEQDGKKTECPQSFAK